MKRGKKKFVCGKGGYQNLKKLNTSWLRVEVDLYEKEKHREMEAYVLIQFSMS